MMIASDYNSNNLSLYASTQNNGTLPIAGINANINGSNIRPLSSNELASQASQTVPYSRSNISKTNTENAGFPREDQSKEGLSSQQNSNTSEARQQASAEAEVQQVINQLKARDTEVRAHEMAHLSAAGQYAKGMNFSYQTGPDGKRYAIGGEVGIDSSPVAGDPQATIDKALIIQRAALAPAEPSAQDRKVAQQASQMMAAAQAELQALNRLQDEDSVEVVDKSEQSESSNANLNRISTDDENKQIPVNFPNFQDVSNSLMQGLMNERNQFDLRMKIAV